MLLKRLQKVRNVRELFDNVLSLNSSVFYTSNKNARDQEDIFHFELAQIKNNGYFI